jgi:PAS domain S-box-containing protein
MSSRILIADDDERLLSYYETLFGQREADFEGLHFFSKTAASIAFTTRTFRDGVQLVDYFRAEFERNVRIPLCLLDMRMFPLDGLRTAEALRAIDPAVIIIIITAYSDVRAEDVRQRLHEDIYFVKKPFNDDELLALVTSLVRSWERQQALQVKTQQLDHEASLLHALMDSLPDSIYFKDLKSRFIRVNRGFRLALGISDETAETQIIGKTDFDFQPPELASGFFEEEQRLFQTGVPIIDRLEFNPTRAGEDRWLAATKVPIRNAEGNITGLVGISRDVTAGKQAELVMQSTLKREKELNDLRSEFIALVSHEFRTPLATIQAACDALQTYMSQMSPEQVKRRLDKIQQQVRLMTELHEDVITLGFLQMQHATPSVATPALVNIDLAAYCQALLPTLTQIDNGNHEIVADVPGEPVHTCVYERLLHLILINLVKNAIKYSPAGSTITLAIRHTATHATLAVSDEGIGIPPEDLPFVLEPFHRASNVEKIDGTGLGLAITKYAVAAQHGQVHITSTLGRGTQVTLTLPLAKPA